MSPPASVSICALHSKTTVMQGPLLAPLFPFRTQHILKLLVSLLSTQYRHHLHYPRDKSHLEKHTRLLKSAY